MYKGTFYSLLVFLFSLPRSSLGQEVPRIQERIKSELPRRCKEYSAFAKRLRASFDEKGVERRTNEVLRDWHLEIMQSDSFALVHGEIKIPTRKRSYVFGRNSRYSFLLERGRNNSSWAISNVALNAALKPKDELSQVEQLAGRWLADHYLVFDRILPDFISDPQLVIKQTRFLDNRDSGIVRVDFNHRIGAKNERQALDGWIELDTDHYWCIQAYELEYQDEDLKGRQKEENQYSISSLGYPLLKTHHSRDTSLPGSAMRWDHELTRNFTFREHNGIPDEQFTLTAFGLPEPAGLGVASAPTSKATSWILYFGGGVILLAFAAGYTWYSRGKRATPGA